MLTIDGDIGEGGGQVLRTALALSVCRQIPFRIHNIRARRKNPGLQPQHLAAVNAAAAISQARVQGAEIGSSVLVFEPADIIPGNYEFRIGTAGSATLVMQTILPALMLTGTSSSVRVEGGTHNPLSPPFEFFARAFCPLLNRMGARIETALERPGFYPRGGGLLRVNIHPATALQPLILRERGTTQALSAEILLAHLPIHIAQRERAVLQESLTMVEDAIRIHEDDSAYSPGNAISVFIPSEHVTEVFSSIGQRGKPAETVAGEVVDEVNGYLLTAVPVGVHLADQLLLPLALANGGEYLTQVPSLHTRTNMNIITQFTGIIFTAEEITDKQWKIAIR